jgi:hypothetical protein
VRLSFGSGNVTSRRRVGSSVSWIGGQMVGSCSLQQVSIQVLAREKLESEPKWWSICVYLKFKSLIFASILLG